MFRLRPPTLADADDVLRVVQARETADLGAPDVSAGDVSDLWQASAFDLAYDGGGGRGCCRGGDRLRHVVAPGALAVVDPAREGEGVGSALLAWAEQRARMSGRPAHRQLIASGNGAGHKLLERAGYRHVRSYWRLVRALDLAPEVPAPPAGVSIAPVGPAVDAPALSPAAEAAFAGSEDYEPESFGALLDEHLSAHDFDPSERGRGLGSTLLLSVFAAFAAAGLREAYLEVASDNPRALGLYEGVGRPSVTVRTLSRSRSEPAGLAPDAPDPLDDSGRLRMTGLSGSSPCRRIKHVVTDRRTRGRIRSDHDRGADPSKLLLWALERPDRSRQGR